MKKYLFCIIVLAFGFSLTALAQNPNKLIAEFAQAENAEEVNIDGLLMQLGKKLSGQNGDDITKNIDAVQVIELSNCSTKVKDDFLKRTKNLKDADGYETLMRVKEKDNNVRIVVRKEKDTIKEMIIMVHDKDSPVIVKLTGNIKEEEITKLTDKYGK